MIMVRSVACILLLAGTVLAAPDDQQPRVLSGVPPGHTVVIEEPELCCGWTTSPPLNYAHNWLPEPEELEIVIAIHAKERNIAKLKEVALAVSTPGDPKYGQHLTATEVDELTAPLDSDMQTIRSWLRQHARLYEMEIVETRGRRFVVRTSLTSAEVLLSTSYRKVHHVGTGQKTYRGSDYWLPYDVWSAVSSLTGVHGLPLPPKPNQLDADTPAKVTPSVIASTYQVPTGHQQSSKSQAVAEFQGQTMNSTDLSTFFSNYLPALPASDAKVSKFVGDAGDKHGEVEASLDVQYMMGVSPGVSTEFWLYDPMDFCADLKNWTSSILEQESPPSVFSVSYGWQGNLSQIGCSGDNVDAVDKDFVQLAARGVTIVFASGDSGSGYSSMPTCGPSDVVDDVSLQGTVLRTTTADEAEECCFQSGDHAGFTYEGGSSVPPQQYCGAHPGAHGDTVTGAEMGTFLVPSAESCCIISCEQGVGYNYIPRSGAVGQQGGHCQVFRSVTGAGPHIANATSGTNEKRVPGKCTIYSKVTSQTPSSGSTSSKPRKTDTVKLWPSWPASSPWVTAVGATRFLEQTAGDGEMATDQFGSGGGFSAQFGQSPDATWQSSAVQDYLQVVPKELPFPPDGSFPTAGRATPDVAALGEGFQVLTDGNLQSVGGTSASAPLFGGMVSLMNAARETHSLPAMGFLNPWIYKHADVWNDVTVGTNAIGRGTGPIKYGFNCTKGWDAATGMGTPIYPAMLKAALDP